MITYDEDGAGAARAWLARSGYADNPKFHDLVAAAINAVPRARDRDEFARPEARCLEGLRVTLFDDIPAPPDPDTAPPAVQLSFGGEGTDDYNEDDDGEP
jgi:hypothetical protein